MESASRDGVIDALDSLAVQLRKKLGEPAASVDKYNVPLAAASSRSLEALELLTQGYRKHLGERASATVPYYQRAVQTDSNLALAHAALSSAYNAMDETASSQEAARKAFALRDRLAAPARFSI